MAAEPKTLKVKLNTSRAGHVWKNGRVVGEYVQNVGQVIDLPTDEANRLIERGQASPVE